MLQPKRRKYRKEHRGRRTGKATRSNFVHFGEYGLQALESAWLTARQLEAARIAITGYVRRAAPVWIRAFPHKPITKKPAETRQGGGKGDIEAYVAIVRRGNIVLEMGGVDEGVAREAMRRAARKLPFRTRFVVKEPVGKPTE